jgi:hypothetical protein
MWELIVGRHRGFDIISVGLSDKYINIRLNNILFSLNIALEYLYLMACFPMLRSKMGGIEL